MAQNFRQKEILDLAKQHGKVVVEDLAAHFDVTVQTIRRDLTELCEAGQLTRVYGGAILRSGVVNIGYEDRRGLMTEEKEAIARACARAIPDEASLFLGIGTTTEAVARALSGHRHLMVVTNNMHVASILSTNESCEVMVVGGVVRRPDNGLVGDVAVEIVRNFKVDVAVLGASAIDQEGDLLDFDIRETRISQAVLARARRTHLVADHSKFERTAPVRIASLADVDAFFTDRPLPHGLDTRCAEWGTQVVMPG